MFAPFALLTKETFIKTAIAIQIFMKILLGSAKVEKSFKNIIYQPVTLNVLVVPRNLFVLNVQVSEEIFQKIAIANKNILKINFNAKVKKNIYQKKYNQDVIMDVQNARIKKINAPFVNQSKDK